MGSGANRVAIISHLDTVPPGDTDWRAFEPRIEQRDYQGTKTDFLVGRGAIDDKGPAVAALHALLDVLPGLDKNPDLLQDVTLEVLFDAMWSVRAEKGIERPVFSAATVSNPDSGLWIVDLSTEAGPVNQIADFAKARITGSDSAALDAYARTVEPAYTTYPFDDPDYHAADLEVSRDGADIVLTTRVAGA